MQALCRRINRKERITMTTNRGEYIENIAEIIKSQDTYFDSSALMHKGFTEFIRKNYQQLRVSEAKICVLYSTYNFVEYLMNSPDIKTAENVKETYEKLNSLIRYNILSLKGKPDNRYRESQQILIDALQNRMHKPQAFVTNNRALHHDLLLQKNNKSCFGYPLQILHLSNNGFIFSSEISSDNADKAAKHNDEDIESFFKLFRIA